MTAMRETGIDVVGGVPWGTHFCYFYETKTDLLELLVAYFAAGLAHQEFCLWLVDEQVSIEEATNALRAVVPTLDQQLAAGNIEIIPHSEWYFAHDPTAVAAYWQAKLGDALASGRAGMRTNSSKGWATGGGGTAFAAHEAMLAQWITQQPTLVLCVYALARASAADLFDAAHAHQCVVAKRHGRWDMLEVPPQAQVKDKIKRLNEELAQRVGEQTRQLALTNEVLRREINERQQTERALHLSQQLTQSTLNSLSAHICVLDDQGTIVAVNSLWKKFAVANALFVDQVSEGINYLQVCEASQGDDRPTALAFAAGIQSVIQRQRDYFELEYPCHSPQEERWFIGRVTPLLGAPANHRWVVVAHENITTLRLLEVENKQLTTQFFHAQKMESIGRLAGGVAHDFNNLLVPIIGFAETSLRKVAPDSPLYTNLKRIKEAGERAASLTRQILAFSRQQQLEVMPLDLNRLISEFGPILRRLIGEDISLQIHLSDHLPALNADKGQLVQVLLNLAVNARDAMPDGGVLMITTAPVSLTDLSTDRAAELPTGSYILLAVSDTGMGMDDATQQRIFEPFYTTKPQGKGTGLGLSTVFSIVKQHGGTIYVNSHLNQGTTFTIYLPVTVGALGEGATPPPVAEAVDGTETVLLVEDEESVRQLVMDILQTHGYRVLEASTPGTALALAATYAGPIDLLLTDLVMPQMNGQQLFEQITAIRKELNVLYMSGYPNSANLPYPIAIGTAAFLQKPFTIDQLLEKVRAVLG
jgi:signal transduction histidine kinase